MTKEFVRWQKLHSQTKSDWALPVVKASLIALVTSAIVSVDFFVPIPRRIDGFRPSSAEPRGRTGTAADAFQESRSSPTFS